MSLVNVRDDCALDGAAPSLYRIAAAISANTVLLRNYNTNTPTQFSRSGFFIAPLLLPCIADNDETACLTAALLLTVISNLPSE